MFRLWGKIWKDNRMEKDTVYEEESDDTRTHKIFRVGRKLRLNDLGGPILVEKKCQ